MIERILRSMTVILLTSGTTIFLIKNATGEVTFWGAVSTLLIIFVIVKGAEYLAFRTSGADTP